MKRSRIMRLVLAGVLLGAAAPAGGQQGDGSTFLAFEGRTDSYPAGIATKLLAALPLPVEAYLTRTRSEINSQPRAVAYAGVVDVPLGELLGLYNFPAKLPSYCYATYPGTPDAECGVQPLLAPPEGGEAPTPASEAAPAQEAMPTPTAGRGVSHADGDGFATDATAAESRAAAGGFSSESFSFASSRSRSFSRIVDGVLRTGTEAVLSQVDIGGAISFEQLKSAAEAHTDGKPGGAGSATALTVSGVEVMGEPVGGPGEMDLSTLASEVLAPMADSLRSQGVTISVLEPPATEQSPDGRLATAEVHGMRIETRQSASGNGAVFTLGVARASATAVRPSEERSSPAGDEAGGGILDPGALPTPVASDPVPAPATQPPQDDFSAPVPSPQASRSRSFAPTPSPPASFPASPASPGAPSPAPAGGDTAFSAFPQTSPSLTDPASAGPSGRPEAPATLASAELIGERAADRLGVLYAFGALAICVLGALAFVLPRRARI
ncbi:MAG: hypothetical protein ACRDY7_06800 [Acidimicrobiia bacterium]